MFSIRDVPCGSCPYRKDCPSGIWHHDEYEKLREFDRPTGEQPPAPFLCHDADRQSVLCRGWVETNSQPGKELLALRLLAAFGKLDDEDLEACSIECFESGNEAADHGQRDIDDPSDEAVRRADKLLKIHPDLQAR